MIRLFAIFALVAAFSLNAMAGESAERRIIGFSADGTWFAFEEFGVADGTGAPYASIYIINTSTDSWAEGTPIRVNFGEQPAPVSKALAKARKIAAPILNRLAITEPGILLASKPVTMISANERRIDFYRHMNNTGPAQKMAYVVKEIDFPDRDNCKTMEINEKGFSLFATRGGSPLQEVYKDKRIPASRLCPMKYSISDIIEYSPPGKPVLHVVLIHMFHQGFEGPDLRYLAIPVTLP